MRAGTNSKKATRKFERAVLGEEPQTDVLDTLKEEHDEVKDLLKKLANGATAAQRKSILKQIKEALVPHSRAEEKVVYDAIIALREKSAKQDGEEGYMEHGLADKMLATLGKIKDPMSAEFSAGAKVLKELVEHHIEEEESNVWSDVRKNFSDEDRYAMNAKFEAAKKTVRIPS